MSKPTRRSITCGCGQTFDADVFRSANVTLQPQLKDDILAGRFNRVRCPSCGREIIADVPFLYHDMDAARMIWVYPPGSAHKAEAIREKIRRSRQIIDSVLPAPASEEPDVIFGVDNLIRLLNGMA